MQTTLLVIILLVNIGLLLLIRRCFEQSRLAQDSHQKELIAHMEQCSEPKPPETPAAEKQAGSVPLLSSGDVLLRSLHGAYPTREQLRADMEAIGCKRCAGAGAQAALFSLGAGQELDDPRSLLDQVQVQLGPVLAPTVLPWSAGTVLTVSNAEQQDALCAAGRSIIQTMNDVFAVDVTCGIGEAVSSPHELPRSVDQAQKALLYKLFSGVQSVILYQDIALRERGEPEYPETALKSLLRDLRQFNVVQATKDVEDFFAGLETCSAHTALLGVSHVVSSICLRMQRSEIPPAPDLDYVSVMKQIEQIQVLAKMKEAVLRLLDTYFELNPSKVTAKRDDSLDTIVAYMEAHYADPDFSANDLKEIMHYSDNHIRNLFKEAYQCTPTEYLFQLRMRKAKELLATTGVKISDIARMVGYPNSKYFYSLFKKNTGMTMNQYRLYTGNGQEQPSQGESEADQ